MHENDTFYVGKQDEVLYVRLQKNCTNFPSFEEVSQKLNIRFRHFLLPSLIAQKYIFLQAQFIFLFINLYN